MPVQPAIRSRLTLGEPLCYIDLAYLSRIRRATDQRHYAQCRVMSSYA